MSAVCLLTCFRCSDVVLHLPPSPPQFDKLGFYTSVSISTVLFSAFIIRLVRSRRKWKRRALAGESAGRGAPRPSVVASSTVSRYTVALVAGAAAFFYYLIFNLGEVYGSAKGKSRGSSRDKERLSRLVVVFGKYELDETKFCLLVLASIVLLVGLGAQIGIWSRQQKEARPKKKEEGGWEKEKEKVSVPPAEDALDVVIVGCGPKSVGWFHLMQFLDLPWVNVRAIVEPYYLDKTKCPFPPSSFVDLVMMADDMGIQCVNRVGRLEKFRRRTLCVIAGRTRDNPRLFRECVGLGASHVYLEAPGAPSVAQLGDMESLAATRGVEVSLGYQRRCAPYVEEAIALSRATPRSHVFLCHNEDHPSGALRSIVDRCPEGMLRSMAAQELAVLVTAFGVRADEIESFKVNTNRLFSEKQTYYDTGGGSGVTDFSRAAFKISTTNGRSVSVMADRCGGLVSFAVVKSHTGMELRRFPSLSEEEAAAVQEELREDKEIDRQFVIEREEYLELKRRVVESILGGDSSATSGLVSIRDGIEVMRLADYCTAEINAVLKVDA